MPQREATPSACTPLRDLKMTVDVTPDDEAGSQIRKSRSAVKGLRNTPQPARRASSA